MRAEKKNLVDEVLDWLKEAPFMILVDYQGLTVDRFRELRRRLGETDASCRVVKNSILRLAGRDLEHPEFDGALHGQTAIVFGAGDVCAAAKVLKKFQSEFQKPRVKGGMLDRALLDVKEIAALADLPPRDVLRAQLLGMLQAPASALVRVLNEPASSLARVLKAKEEEMRKQAA